ncbi:MAG: hypothetical protein COZ98_01700 [Candidatus Omnitrophica bacterium CG_4_8_14_3_um_filter_43_15]
MLSIMRSNKKGFTFIEIIISVLIFSVIAVGIYYAFGSGVITSRRLNSESRDHQQVAAALDLMADEIASFVPSEKVKFTAEKNSLSFLKEPYLKNVRGPAKARFFLNEANNALTRTYEPLDSKDVISEELFSPVKALSFSYLCKNPQDPNSYEWVDSFDPENRPECRAIKISVTTAQIQEKIVVLYAGVKPDAAA